MAKAMTAAQEGEFTNLARAGAECGLEMGPPPRTAARHSSTGAQRDLGSAHAGLNTANHPSSEDHPPTISPTRRSSQSRQQAANAAMKRISS